MTKTLFIEILAALPKQEQKQFNKYVHSPFFNKNEKVQRLYVHILKYAPTFNHPDLSKPQVYRLLFGELDYQELRLNNVISDLLQLLYGYLTYTQQQSATRQQHITLLAALLERNLERPIPRIVRKVEQLRSKEKHQSIDFYRDESRFFEQLNYYSITRNNDASDANLQHISDALDVYYWTHKLRNACEMLSRIAIAKTAYHSKFLEPFLAIYSQDSAQFQKYPVLQVYHQTYVFLKAANEEEYHKLSEVVAKHQVLLPPLELHNLYGYMLNYCVRQINFGRTTYYTEILRLYRILIDKGVLLQKGYLSHLSFINITTSGIRVKEYAWTEQFIHAYKGYLREAERKNTVDHQLAVLYFAKEAYQKTLQFLQQVEFTDILYHASAKLILLKVYYELDEVEAFYPLVNTTKKLLGRSRELSDYHRLSYSNFVKLAKRLYDLKINLRANAQSKWVQIGEQLENTSPLANKGWLLGKYQAMRP